MAHIICPYLCMDQLVCPLLLSVWFFWMFLCNGKAELKDAYSTYNNYNDASLKPCNPENIRVQTPQGTPQRKYPGRLPLRMGWPFGIWCLGGWMQRLMKNSQEPNHLDPVLLLQTCWVDQMALSEASSEKERGKPLQISFSLSGCASLDCRASLIEIWKARLLCVPMLSFPSEQTIKNCPALTHLSQTQADLINKDMLSSMRISAPESLFSIHDPSKIF